MPAASLKNRKAFKSKTRSTSSREVTENKKAPLYKRILVPTDFSKTERHALEQARSLAQLTGAKVYLMHVIERFYPGELPYSYIKIDTRAMHERMIRDIELLQVGLFDGIKTEMVLSEGTPFSEIISAAKEKEVDLIVMSTHGFTGFTRIMLGSTAERVVRYAGCPVLAVREKQWRKRK